MVDDTNTFKLIQVKIGNQVVDARPIRWDKEIETSDGKDAKGEEATPTEYNTVCPHCGCGVVFEGQFSCVQCPECKEGEFKVSLESDSPFQTLDIDSLLDDVDDGMSEDEGGEDGEEKPPLDYDVADIMGATKEEDAETSQVIYEDYLDGDGDDDDDDLNIEDLIS